MKKVVVALLVVCLLVIGGYFLIPKGFFKQQESATLSRVKSMQVKQKTEAPSRINPSKVKQITVTNPSQNGALQNELTQEEITKAKEIIRWLKENDYTVTPHTISYNGETRIALNFAYTSHGPDNLVTLQNLGPNKVELTISNVGSTNFTFDANGELQPSK